jgi:ABC-type transport system involved in multi-copper enzyme maturation permease subunit
LYSAAVLIFAGVATIAIRLRRTVEPRAEAQSSRGKRPRLRRLLFLIDDERPRKPFGRFNPIAAKERRTNRLRGGRWTIRIFYSSLGLALLLALMSLYGGSEHVDLLAYVARIVVALQIGIVTLVAPSLTSASLSSEIEAGTFEFLRLAPLRPRQIFWGKLFPAVPGALLPILAMIPAYAAICYVDASYIPAMTKLLPTTLLAAGVCLFIGTACSSWSANSARATIVAYLIVVALLVVPLFAGLQSSLRLSPQAARWLGSISPLVVVLNLLPSGDANIAALLSWHVQLMIGICIVAFVIARLRLTQLTRSG